MQIEANITEADIGQIKPDMNVSFTVDAYPDDVFDGVVQQIRLSPTEESNVVMYTVVIQVDNSSRKLLPGMTATVDIKIHEANDVLTIPTMVMQYKPSADLKAQMDVQKINDLKKDEIVLYQIKNNKIVPVIVQKGLSNLTAMEIKSGLKQGEEVILQSKGGRRRK